MRVRRTAAITGSAVACVAVLVTAVAGLRTTPPANVAPAADTPQSSLLTLPDQFSTVLGEYHTGPYQVGPVGAVTAGYQELPVYRDGQTWQDENGDKYALSDGMITVYRAGVFNPDTFGVKKPIPAASTAAIANAQEKYGPSFSVTVAGRPGVGRELWYPAAQAFGEEFSAPTKDDGYVRTTLAWQYAPGAWATYVPDQIRRSNSRQDAIKIAAAVTPQPDRQIRIPYKLGFIPAGWQIASVTESTTKISRAVSEVFLHKGAIPKAEQANRVDLGMPGVVHILVLKGHPNDENKGDSIDPKFRGVRCDADFPACKVILDGYFVDVDGRGTELSVADVHKIAKKLAPVDVADRDAWVPVTK